MARVYGQYIEIMEGDYDGLSTDCYVTVRSWLDYAVSTNDATKYKLSLAAGLQYRDTVSSYYNFYTYTKYETVTGTGKTTKKGQKKVYVGRAQTVTIIDQWTDWEWTKTHAQQTITINANYAGMSFAGPQKNSTATITLTIPPKSSYPVTYNANGGSNDPANQIKWHGENLILAIAKPTRDQYDFIGWATSQENANAGTVAYQPGATYTGNVALTLYAVWAKTYYKPTISNLEFIRCNSNGVPNDEGEYALVTFDWSVDRWKYSNNAVSGNISVTLGDNTISIAVSGTAANNKLSGSITKADKKKLGSSGRRYSVDSSFNGCATITDTQTGEAVHSTTINAILPATEYPLDISANGKSLGIFRPANDEEDYELAIKGKFVEDNGTRDIDLQISESTIQAFVNLGMNLT